MIERSSKGHLDSGPANDWQTNRGLAETCSELSHQLEPMRVFPARIFFCCCKKRKCSTNLYHPIYINPPGCHTGGRFVFREVRGWSACAKLKSSVREPHGVGFRGPLNPRLTKLFFVTRLTKGVVATPSLDFPNQTPMKLNLVSIGSYGPSLLIHTKMSTIGRALRVMTS